MQNCRSVVIVISHYNAVGLEFLSVENPYSRHIHAVSAVGIQLKAYISVGGKLVDIHIKLVVQFIGTIVIGVMELLARYLFVEIIHLLKHAVDILHGILKLLNIGFLNLLDIVIVTVERLAKVGRGIACDSSNLAAVRLLIGVILKRIEELLRVILQSVRLKIIQNILNLRKYLSHLFRFRLDNHIFTIALIDIRISHLRNTVGIRAVAVKGKAVGVAAPAQLSVSRNVHSVQIHALPCIPGGIDIGNVVSDNILALVCHLQGSLLNLKSQHRRSHFPSS